MPTISELLAKARQSAQNHVASQAAAKATAAQIAAEKPAHAQPALPSVEPGPGTLAAQR